MKVIAVDDEKNNLVLLTDAIHEVDSSIEVEEFRYPEDVLEYAKDNKIDIAFLDVQMPSMTGLELAKKLKEINKTINIIFVTGYSEYMEDAFQMHASGYIKKPVRAEYVERELNNLRYEVKNDHEVFAQTFGNFDLFVNGKPVAFKLSKAKELLAYLIDRNGSSMTRKDIALSLFEEREYDTKVQDYISKIFRDLAKTLKEYGVEDILIKSHNAYAVDVNKFKCDAYLYDEGDPKYLNLFHGEYMTQYSWSEYSMDRFYE